MAELTKRPTNADGTTTQLGDRNFTKVATAPSGGLEWSVNASDFALEFAITDNDTAPVVDDPNDFTRIVIRPQDGPTPVNVAANNRLWARIKRNRRNKSFCYIER